MLLNWFYYVSWYHLKSTLKESVFGMTWYMQKQSCLQFFFDLQIRGCKGPDKCAITNKRWIGNCLYIKKVTFERFYSAFRISISLSSAASGAVSPNSMEIVTKGTVHWHSASSAVNASKAPFFSQRSKSSVPVLTDSFAFAGSWKMFVNVKIGMYTKNYFLPWIRILVSWWPICHHPSD